MATYTAITNGEIDAESPITDLLLGRLRDNPLAIVGGAAGAPRIFGTAAARTSQNELPVLSVSAADTYSMAAGITQTNGTLTTSSLTNVVAVTFVIDDYTGSARFKATQTPSGAVSITLELFKNNVLVQSWTTNATTNRSVDVSIAPGDVFEWRHRTSSGPAPSTVSNLSMTGTNRWTGTTFWRPEV
jgi:hypothetical protein